MARVEASVEVPAPLAGAWDLYFDADRWASWVDGFGSLVSRRGYPEEGGELVWRSNPAGRGEVRERVLAHQPRTLHRVEFEDPESTGQLETKFEIAPGGADPQTRIAQVLSYSLSGGGPFRAITDFLFIRSQMKRSLERSLRDLRLELAHGG